MSGLVAPDGRPLALPKEAPCPRCGAGPQKRVLSGGFGAVISVLCGQCGQTLQEQA